MISKLSFTGGLLIDNPNTQERKIAKIFPNSEIALAQGIYMNHSPEGKPISPYDVQVMDVVEVKPSNGEPYRRLVTQNQNWDLNPYTIIYKDGTKEEKPRHTSSYPEGKLKIESTDKNPIKHLELVDLSKKSKSDVWAVDSEAIFYIKNDSGIHFLEPDEKDCLTFKEVDKTYEFSPRVKLLLMA